MSAFRWVECYFCKGTGLEVDGSCRVCGGRGRRLLAQPVDLTSVEPIPAVFNAIITDIRDDTWCEDEPPACRFGEPMFKRRRAPGNRWFDLDPEREPLEWELLRALARPADPIPRLGLDPIVYMMGPWPPAWK